MITKNTTIAFQLTGTLLQDYDPYSLLFFDIETTGFTAASSSLYLIGAVTRQGNDWILTQWFAESSQEEAEVLQAFLEFSTHYKQLIHFNGDRFDLPYLAAKCAQYQLYNTLSLLISRDLYRLIRPLKSMLSLSALNQRCLEEFLGIFRRDPYTGGELIHVYHTYEKSPDSSNLQKLLLHNHEDLLGMLDILPILSYRIILSGNFQITDYQIEDSSLILQGRLPLYLPQVFSFRNQWLYLTGSQDRLAMEIFGVRDTLKYFFPDFKNYYYLPEEDIALHKSVAAYVDKAHREPAKLSTCYNKKNGFYVPQFEELHKPVFKTDYHDKQMYFSCNDKFLENRENLYQYACHLLAHL